MRKLLLLLVVLLGSIALTLTIKNDPGYMLLSWGGVAVELTIAYGGLIIMVAFVLMYTGLRLLAHSWRIPERARDWNRRRRVRRARRALNRGMIAYSEGHWKKAETTLNRYAASAESPMVYYLAAARAAQQLGAYQRRDEYLHKAHESMPGSDVAVALTQAELQLDHGQQEQALATLKHLRAMAPKHPYVLKLLAILYERLRDWEQLREMMPEFKRHKVMADADREALELRTWEQLLEAAHKSGDTEGLKQLWSKLPKHLKQNQPLHLAYAAYILEAGDNNEAETLLRNAIDTQWSEEVVYRYGLIQIKDCAVQLKTAEAWLTEHSRSSILLLTLGRLSLRNQLWGKARSYLEASIGIAPKAETYRELGTLLEKMGENKEAMECYREGLRLADGAFIADSAEPPHRNKELASTQEEAGLQAIPHAAVIVRDDTPPPDKTANG